MRRPTAARYDRRGQDPAGRATSGKTWPGETIVSGPLAFQWRPRWSRAVGRGFPVRNPLGLDRAVRRFHCGSGLWGHGLEAELVGAFLGQRQADETAAVAGHEVDRVGRRHLRRDDEVPSFSRSSSSTRMNMLPCALRDDALRHDEHRGAASINFSRAPMFRRSDSIRPAELAQRMG